MTSVSPTQLFTCVYNVVDNLLRAIFRRRRRWSDTIMHKSGKFDVTDDSRAHVTDCQPIRKSLLHLRPDKLFRRSTKEAATADAAKLVSRLRPATSDGTSLTARTQSIGTNHLSAVITSQISVTGYQPQPAVTVSKSDGVFQPEVEYRQIQPKMSFERTGSLRDRWRQLNDEFKRVYQQRSSSPQATPSQGHAPPSQGETKVRQINRFKEVDRRFSNISRAVSNMSARQIHNTTSGRTGSSEMTSLKPEVILPSMIGDERMSDAATGEAFLSKSPDGRRHLYTDDDESAARQRSLSDECPAVHRPYLSNVAASGPIGWYSDSQSTTNDNRPSSSLNNHRLSDRGDNYAGSKQSEQTVLLPSGECKYKTVCERCGETITPPAAAVDNDEDDDDDSGGDVQSQSMKRSRDIYSKDKQVFTAVLSTRFIVNFFIA